MSSGCADEILRRRTLDLHEASACFGAGTARLHGRMGFDGLAAASFFSTVSSEKEGAAAVAVAVKVLWS